MQLLTAELRRRLPALYATEKDDDPLVQAKWFLPGTRWTWYATEFDGDDICFGFVKSGLDDRFDELGYFSIAELEAIAHPLGFRVERHEHWTPTPLSVITKTTEIV
jgi:hypothetical protein